MQGKGPGEAPGGTRRPASLQSVGKSRPPVPDSRKEGQGVLGQVWSAASYPLTISGHSGLQTARESHSTLRTLAKAVTKPGDDNHGSRDQHRQLTDSLLEMQGLRPGPRPAESGCRLTRSQGVTCTSQSDKGTGLLCLSVGGSTGQIDMGGEVGYAVPDAGKCCPQRFTMNPGYAQKMSPRKIMASPSLPTRPA